MPRVKRPRSPSLELPAASNQSKKLKLLASHALESPFPEFTSPTPAEAQQVHDLLAQTHPDLAAAARAASTSNDAAGTCGRVPNVLESLIGTVLSQNTSARNSTAAKRSLDAAFGRNAFAAIADADRAAVVAAIRTGGLAHKKAGVIQGLLRAAHARHGAYSLQHLAGEPDRAGARRAYSDAEAMAELVAFEGVGPKTAACVLLFCLGRASFPVDTHVFRLARLLGWVPARADRVSAQAHLDIRVPDGLKYGLHVLMVHHGRRCGGCKASGKGACVLKTWLRTKTGVKAEGGLDALALALDDEKEKKPLDPPS